MLVEHFFRKLNASSSLTRVPGHIMDMLIEYDWPGNVRELRNVLQRYVTLGDIAFLAPEHKSPPPSSATELDLRAAAQQTEQSLIAKALRQTGGNRTQAARLLGISRRALFRKLANADVP